MKILYLSPLALLAVFCFNGCATQGSALSERERIVLNGRIDDLEDAQMRQKTKITSLEKRVAQLEDILSMMNRNNAASRQEREVVKIAPANAPAVNAQTPENTDDYTDIVISEDKKRSYFGSHTQAKSKPSTAPLTPYENVVSGDRLPSQNYTKTQDSDTIDLSPMRLYQEGIDLYRQGNFVDAKKKFEQFLATSPDVSYVDNALYWIGECFYGQGLYNEAAGYFHKIVRDYPDANKVPDALLKVALTYQQLGKSDSAREMLKYLMDAFPNSEAARIGKEKYEVMNLQSR